MRTLVIWGAGRIGRGFVADIFHEDSDWRIVFVDIDKALVDRLNEAKAYTIFKALPDGVTRTRIEGGFTALHTDDAEALKAVFAEENLLLDIAVHEPKLGEVADMVAPLLVHRSRMGAGNMDIMMNVNMARPDTAFKKLLEERLTGAPLTYYRNHIGVTGIAAMCISPVATEAMLAEDPLALLNNGYHEQAIGRYELKGKAPTVKRLRLAANVPAEETRKLYTLNMAHAMCCYLGVKKGYATVIEAISDPEIRAIVTRALEESSRGLEKAFGFGMNEMAQWRKTILSLLDNRFIDDNLPRLGADTRRKLAAADRLCGPARLCLEAEGEPSAIASAIRAGFDFCHDDVGTNYVRARVEKYGLDAAVQEICRVAPGDRLYELILQK